MRYHVHAVTPNTWEVVDETGHPVYDNAPHGQDKPLVFRDLDLAYECAERLTAESEMQAEE